MKRPFIIGFSDSVHDRSVCLFEGARPLVAVEEERLTRVKHGLDFYDRSRTDPSVFAHMNLESTPAAESERRLQAGIDYCLDAAGIRADDVALTIGNSLHNSFPFRHSAVFINHHLAHACSTFFASGFEEAAILVADGYGDRVADTTYETVALGFGRGQQVRLEGAVSGSVSSYYDMENSLGVFYRIGTLLSGFGVFDEGKTMGLSSYGRPAYEQVVSPHIRFESDRVSIDNRSIWETMNREVPERSDFQVRADIAMTFQTLLNRVVLHYAKVLHARHPVPRLCMAGGVALNCVTNAFLLEHSPFSEIFVFPAPGDNGISFGAAWFGAHHLFGLPRGERLVSASLGRTYSDDRLHATLAASANGFRVERLNPEDLPERAADLLAAGQIVMWYQGGSEIGPRALGHRSILADPRQAGTKDYINKHVKFREMFRPLAPIVLQEESSRFFAMEGESSFMLFAPSVRPLARELAPAVVHCDDTARLQTVSRDSDPLVHALVTAFARRTGVPIVLNTSLNGKDEPIVETPEEALKAFLQSPLQYLFLGPYVVSREVKA